jgi:dTDP-4-amino-4,6-dideoxygalactose transaminase
MVSEEAVETVSKVLRSGQIAAGPLVAQFEEEFAAWIGVDHAVAVANGTLALWVGLVAGGIDPGDEVIVPSFTFAGTAGAVLMAGAKPVYADIDPKTFCVTPETVDAVVSPKTRGVMPVHLYGHPAPMDDLAAFCSERGLLLAEDAAQAHGAAIAGRRVGAFGLFGAFSFYPTKNMTTGEGGMVTTNDPGLAEAARRLRNHGMAERYNHVGFGTNARMTDIAAAIGLDQLHRIDRWNAQRAANAAALNARLAGQVVTPSTTPGYTHVFHQYTVRTPDRSALMSSLERHGIGHGIYYPRGCHDQPAYRDPSANLPETDRATGEVLSLPVRPDLSTQEIDRIVEAVRGGT